MLQASILRRTFFVIASASLGSLLAPAQPMPVRLSPDQLDQLVARIALYPDPLLAQILTASTYGNEIPEAAAWVDEHSNLKGEALANAIHEYNLQWEPSGLT